MIARASQLFLPTLRDAPADAEAASHKLLVRGGFIRQVGAGLWTYLPLGWRVHQKVVQIIREEMDAIGGQEMLCPVLTPAELWETSRRTAKGSSWPARTATAGTCAGSRPDGTTGRRSPTSARLWKATPAPCAAGGSSSARQSKWDISSSSERSSRTASARTTSMRTAAS